MIKSCDNRSACRQYRLFQGQIHLGHNGMPTTQWICDDTLTKVVHKSYLLNMSEFEQLIKLVIGGHGARRTRGRWGQKVL